MYVSSVLEFKSCYLITNSFESIVLPLLAKVLLHQRASDSLENVCQPLEQSALVLECLTNLRIA